MATSDSLTSRLDAEFAAAHERIRRMQEDSTRAREGMQSRFEIFTRVRERVGELLAPRLRQLQVRFPDAKTTPMRSRHGDSVALCLQSERFKVILTLSLSHDGSVGKALIDYDLDISPVFIPFARHERLEIPLDPVDDDAITRWLDDRIVAFVRAYISIQFTKQYEGDNMVLDPVAHIRFAKMFANSSLEYGGETYYFVSEQTRREFGEKSASYAERGHSGEPPRCACEPLKRY
jgi:YHS domain-containing protein